MAITYPKLSLAAGVLLAVIGYLQIGISCPYGLISTIMTGQIIFIFAGIWTGLSFALAYKWVLAVAVYLVLSALYALIRQRKDAEHAVKPATDPLFFVTLSVGVAVIGFLATYYPCPVPVDLWLILTLEVRLGAFGIPYGAILSLAIGLLLYAAYAHATQRRNANSS